jgi:hypothetical protein
MKDVGNEHTMASEENQIQPPVNRLGFHEIVPGLGAEHSPEQASGPIEIPEFNLDNQMMALHRKTTAKRRVGPKQKPTDKGEQGPQSADTAKSSLPKPPNVIWAGSLSPDINTLVSEMVRSDIDRLCQAWAGRPVQG